jgi:hypothetical protein
MKSMQKNRFCSLFSCKNTSRRATFDKPPVPNYTYFVYGPRRMTHGNQAAARLGVFTATEMGG